MRVPIFVLCLALITVAFASAGIITTACPGTFPQAVNSGTSVFCNLAVGSATGIGATEFDILTPGADLVLQQMDYVTNGLPGSNVTVNLAFDANMNGPGDLQFAYSVTVPGALQTSLDLNSGDILSDFPAGIINFPTALATSTNATVLMDVCPFTTGVAFDLPTCKAEEIFSGTVTSGNSTASSLFPVQPVWVYTDITVAAGGSLRIFEEDLVVPEPSSLLLMGSGVLAVILLRRMLRDRRKSI